MLSLFWIALTAVFREPALIVALGNDAAVAVVQSVTLIVVVGLSGLLYLLIDWCSDELIDMQHGESTNDRDESDRDSEVSVTTSETAGGANICTSIEQLSLWLINDNAAEVALAETITGWGDG
jgi:hypothetical protein